MNTNSWSENLKEEIRRFGRRWLDTIKLDQNKEGLCEYTGLKYF